jgi:hypothetical protein
MTLRVRATRCCSCRLTSSPLGGRSPTHLTPSSAGRAPTSCRTQTAGSARELAPINGCERQTREGRPSALPKEPDPCLRHCRRCPTTPWFVPCGGRARHGRRFGRDRGPTRKQREVDVAHRADGSFTGALQSALECSGKRACGGKPHKGSVSRAYRGLNMDDFGEILWSFWSL